MAGKRKIAIGLLFLISAVFIGVAIGSWDSRDWGSFWKVNNLCGPIGAVMSGILRGFFGSIFVWLVPLFLLFWGLLVLGGIALRERSRLCICLLFLAWAGTSIFSVGGLSAEAGILGTKTAGFLHIIAGRIGSILILIGVLALDLLVLFFGSIKSLGLKIKGLLTRSRTGERPPERERKRSRRDRKKPPIEDKTKSVSALETAGEEDKAPVRIDLPPPAKPKPKPASRPVRPAVTGATPADNAPLPDLSLLDDYDEEAVTFSKEELIARSEVIEAKLEDYGLRGKVSQVRPGPVVTTFEFVPASGVKVSQIANRADDISLALAARAIRIQAPIPGKGAVGIEVPNPEPKMVPLKEMMEHFPVDREGLIVVFGKTVTGEPYFADISDMPHLLIAGATGSGKSVCINSIICSLLYNHTPATCRFILVDPKRLELITYNDIPHLLHPVITEARTTLKVLNWLTVEMDRRYKLLAQFGVKNIKSFNQKCEREKLVSPLDGEPVSRLPYYVTIIDELADIMVSMGNEIYPPITRLSQMARAVGIHLVFATQRPSVDVV
ncbi:MAG: DNA translocase FtsK 4TM domain-containing protein, partial [Candidatus Krumholzibacteriota bacterium]|nr:DNA translocase FtsK 4TM domain-containing protein [Candidatus Krumholzibacteriota bacterium]